VPCRCAAVTRQHAAQMSGAFKSQYVVGFGWSSPKRSLACGSAFAQRPAFCNCLLPWRQCTYRSTPLTSLAVEDMSGYWFEDQIEAYRLNAQIVLEFLKSLFPWADDGDFNVHVRYERERKPVFWLTKSSIQATNTSLMFRSCSHR